MEIDRSTIKSIRRDLMYALSTLQDKYGVSIAVGSIGYTSNSFSTKLSAIVTTAEDRDSGLEPTDLQYKSQLLKYGAMHGVDDCFGRIVTIQGKQLALTGINTKATKNIFTAQDIHSGKSYVIPESYASKFSVSRKVFDFTTRKVNTI